MIQLFVYQYNKINIAKLTKWHETCFQSYFFIFSGVLRVTKDPCDGGSD
jgi:hypothetical protein